MLFLISPAKALDFETPVRASVQRQASEPLYSTQAQELITLMRQKSAAQVSALMDLSPALAELNVARYSAWSPHTTVHNSKPALLAFDGDVYGGLDATTLKSAELRWAQEHLVILSGLYGVLRPLDRLQPYRLEMGTTLANRQGRDLYAFWGDTVAEHLNTRLADDSTPVVVNLASIEYARVALRPALQARVVDCVFEDFKGEGYKIISFFAKRARGMMARWAIAERVRSVKKLREFNAEGYAFVAEASTPDRLVFRRHIA
jgi:uncharacterized protein